MRFRENNWCEGSLEIAKNNTIETIKNVFGKYNKNNYYLFIKPELFYKYLVSSIDSDILLLDNKNNIIYKNNKYTIRNPYPNKYYFTNDMKFGRKIFYNGYIIKFDNLFDLQKIHKVIIRWNVESKYDNGDNCDLLLECNYIVDFNADNKENVFSIKSRDCFVTDEKLEGLFKHYQYQFDINEYRKEEFGFNIVERHTQKLNLIADNSRIDWI